MLGLNSVFVRLLLLNSVFASLEKYIDYQIARVAHSNSLQGNGEQVLQPKISHWELAGVLQCNATKKNVQIFQTEKHVFFVSGVELFRFKFSSNKSTVSHFIGNFIGISADNILDVKGTDWNQYAIILIELTNQFQIYLAETNALEGYELHSIERIGKFGELIKVEFIRTRGVNGAILCIMGSRNDNDSGILKIMRWRDTHFTTECEKRVGPMDMIHVLEDLDGQVIVVNIAIKGETATIEIFRMKDQGKRLMRHQNLIIQSTSVRPMSFKTSHYLLGCLRTNCRIYKWSDKQFSIYNNAKLPNHGNILFQTQMNVVAIYNYNRSIILFANPELRDPTILKTSIDMPKQIVIYDEPETPIIRLLVFDGNTEAGLRAEHYTMTFESVESFDPTIVGSSLKRLIQCFSDLKVITESNNISTVEQQLNTVIQRNSSLNVSVIKTTNATTIHNGAINATINQTLTIAIPDLLSKIMKINSNIYRLLKPRSKRNTKSSIKAYNVTIDSNIFETFVLRSRPNNFTGLIKVKNDVTTNSLYVPKNLVNDINLEELAQPRSIVSGLKKVVNLKLQFLAATQINDKFQSQTSDHQSSNNNFTFDGIEVQNINSFSFTDFYKTFYKTGEHNQHIKGNLYLKAPANIVNLNVTTINDGLASNLMTLNTEQTVASNIKIRKFFTSGMSTHLINDYSFKDDLFEIGRHTFIKSPTKIAHMNVKGDIILANELVSKTEHIIGTKVEDLSQIYNNRVVIHGNLILNDVFLEKRQAFINQQRFIYDKIPENYWMKSYEQIVPDIHIFKGRVLTSQLTIDKNFNGHNVDKYLNVKESTFRQNTILLLVEKAVVHGNVIVATGLPTTADYISRNALLREDKSVQFYLHKFENLIVDDLIINEINSNNIRDLIPRATSKDSPFTSIRYDTMNVFGNSILTPKNVSIGFINGKYMPDALKALHDFQHVTKFKDVIFNCDVQIHRLQTLTKINANKLPGTKTNKACRELIVKGSIKFENNLKVKQINNIPNVGEYMNLLVFRNSNQAQIGGIKRFQKGLIVDENCRLSTLNHWTYFNDFFTRVLTQQSFQTIKNRWTFGSMETRSLKTKYINDISTDQLVLTTKDIVIESNLVIQNVHISKLFGNINLDIKGVISNFLTPKRYEWQSVEVNYTTLWPVHQHCLLNDIIYNTIRQSGEQIITGAITFLGEVTMGHVTFSSQNLKINNYPNVLQIYKDALLKSSHNQVITGQKTMSAALTVEENVLVINGYFNTQEINNISILALNASLYNIRRNDVISGKKIFTNFPAIFHLVLDDENGTINGVKAEDIIVESNATIDASLRFAKGLIIKNIEINLVNRQEFRTKLKRRVGSSTNEIVERIPRLVVNDLVIRKQANIEIVNDVTIQDLVIVTSKLGQVISGKKYIPNELRLRAPASIHIINGVNLLNRMADTVFLNQPMVLKNITLPDIMVQRGLTVTNGINGGLLRNTDTKAAVNLSSISVNELKNQISYSLIFNHQKKLLYAEYDSDVEITFNEARRDPYGANIRVTSSRAGSLCGLPNSCVCFFQYTVTFTTPRRLIINSNPFHEHIITQNNTYANIKVSTTFAACDTVYAYTQPATEYSNVTVKLYDSSEHLEYIMPFRIINAKLFKHCLVLQRAEAIHVRRVNLIADMQVISTELYLSTVIEVFEWPIGTFLVIMYESKAVIMEFYENDSKFYTVQEIPLHFDIAVGVISSDSQEYMMIFSCRNSNAVYILKAVNYKKFQISQLITIESKIKMITVTNVAELLIMGIVKENGLFEIYKYNYIEGWNAFNSGYFEGIETLVPLHLDSPPVFLALARHHSAILVTFATQGNSITDT